VNSKKNKTRKQEKSSRNIESLGTSTERKRIYNRKIQELNKMIDNKITVTLKKLKNKQLDL